MVVLLRNVAGVHANVEGMGKAKLYICPDTGHAAAVVVKVVEPFTPFTNVPAASLIPIVPAVAGVPALVLYMISMRPGLELVVPHRTI